MEGRGAVAAATRGMCGEVVTKARAKEEGGSGHGVGGARWCTGRGRRAVAVAVAVMVVVVVVVVADVVGAWSRPLGAVRLVGKWNRLYG